MKIALINPQSPNSRNIKQRCVPPINLMYLASSLLENGFDVKIIDANSLTHEKEEIISILKKYSPDLVGFNLCSELLKSVFDLTYLIKKELVNCKIVLGGPHASAMPLFTLQEFKYADFLLVGECDYTIVDLCKAIQKNKNFSIVKGIYYRINKTIKYNKHYPVIKELDRLPSPSRNLLKEAYDKKLYYSIMINKQIGLLVTSRGCPSNCFFCSRLCNKYRTFSIERIINEINCIYSSGINYIEIFDDNFNIDFKKAERLFVQIKKEKIDISFRIKTKVNTVNKRVLELGKSAGLYAISYGMESGVQKILDNMNKGTTVQMNKKACMITKELGIKCYTNWLLGYPGETRKTIRQTI